MNRISRAAMLVVGEDSRDLQIGASRVVKLPLPTRAGEKRLWLRLLAGDELLNRHALFAAPRRHGSFRQKSPTRIGYSLRDLLISSRSMSAASSIRQWECQSGPNTWCSSAFNSPKKRTASCIRLARNSTALGAPSSVQQ